MNTMEKLIAQQNYILACMVQVLRCICDKSDMARQTAGYVVDEMNRQLSKDETQFAKESEAKA